MTSDFARKGIGMDANWVYSAEEVPEPERFDYWREVLRATFGVESTPLERTLRPFTASFQWHAKASLHAFRYEGDATFVRRGEREIGDRFWNSYVIHIERSDWTRFASGRHDAVASRGTIVLGDCDRPFEAKPETRYRHDRLYLPKSWFDPHLPHNAIAPVSPLSGQSGVARLAASYVDALLQEWDNIADAQMPGVARHAVPADRCRCRCRRGRGPRRRCEPWPSRGNQAAYRSQSCRSQAVARDCRGGAAHVGAYAARGARAVRR
jgi:hypothetical protein